MSAFRKPPPAARFLDLGPSVWGSLSLFPEISGLDVASWSPWSRRGQRQPWRALEQRLAHKHTRTGISVQLHQRPDQQTQNSFICSWSLSLGCTGQRLSSNVTYF